MQKVDVVKLGGEREDSAKHTKQEANKDFHLYVKWYTIGLDGLVLRYKSPI